MKQLELVWVVKETDDKAALSHESEIFKHRMMTEMFPVTPLTAEGTVMGLNPESGSLLGCERQTSPFLPPIWSSIIQSAEGPNRQEGRGRVNFLSLLKLKYTSSPAFRRPWSSWFSRSLTQIKTYIISPSISRLSD